MTCPPAFVSPSRVRARFAEAMSAMYRDEVPLYGALLEIVASINRRGDIGAGEAGRLGAERHGAIRVGTPRELALLRRIFAIMGMHPVGYYDLTVAGVPVHSTAFRPVAADDLAANAFRVFTSLLRLDLIADDGLRRTAAAILEDRRIASPAALALIERAEAAGGLRKSDADAFIEEVLHVFRWHGDAIVDAPTYRRLSDAHPLVADIVAFRGPHINHLTPRVIDIDAAQSAMSARGIDAKAVIEGPPRRTVPILLRQTSFKALAETIRFAAGHSSPGTHTARFGEIEQRGAALTPAGRVLYDALLDRARGGIAGDASHAVGLDAAFAAFPDTIEELHGRGLAYFRYSATGRGRREGALGLIAADVDPRQMVAAGWATIEPLTYEDFLPVSAAGIFQSNLAGEAHRRYEGGAAQAAFEAALGAPVLDMFALYAATERESIDRVRAELCDGRWRQAG